MADDGLVICGRDADRATVFDPSRMTLVRAQRSLAERASRYAHLGHGEEPITDEDRRAWAVVEAALHRTAPVAPDQRPPVVQKLFLGNTYHCNMGCTYCYNELSVKDRKGSEVREGMSMEVARAAIDALIAQAGGARHLQLVYVGGEPLLEKDVLVESFDYAERRCAETGREVSAVVYTNGTLMNAQFIAWAEERGVSLVVSLDGPPALHDQRRIYLSGRPTSRIVLRNIRHLVETTTQPLVRVRAVSVETSALVPLHRYLLDLGFNEIHVQPLYDENGMDTAQESEMLGLLEWYGQLLLDGVVISVVPFEGYIERMLAQGSAIASWYPCSAGREQLAVGPAGQVYPCHHFLEEGTFEMGNVLRGLPMLDQRAPFFQRVDQREPCRSCWARHACGGECYHRAHTAGRGYTGTLPDVCRSRKSMIGMTLEVFAEVAARRPESLARIVRGEYTRVTPKPEAYACADLTPYRA